MASSFAALSAACARSSEGRLLGDADGATKGEPAAVLSAYGRFDDLRETVDEEKAKAYFDQVEGKPLPMFKIKIRAAKVLTDFLVRGVFSLNVTE